MWALGPGIRLQTGLVRSRLPGVVPLRPHRRVSAGHIASFRTSGRLAYSSQPPPSKQPEAKNENNHEHTHSPSASHTHSHSHTAHGHGPEASGHDGHSHSLFGHSHTHSARDNVFLQEKGGIRNPAIRITWIGLLVNVAMAVGKGFGGVVFHSQALIADSVHAVSDLFSDFLTLATVTIGTKPASKYFPNGYGRVETLGSLSVSLLLVMAGVSMGWGSFLSGVHHIWGDVPWMHLLQIGHTHSHSHEDLADINAAWIALGSIFIKEWLYHATMKVADSTGSTVLAANAWHHRVDSLVSVVAVSTIAAGYFWQIKWLDPVGGLIVSIMIAKAGYSTLKEAAIELSDGTQRLVPELPMHQEKVETALAAIQLHGEHFRLGKLEVIPSGPNYSYHMCLLPIGENKLSEFITTSEALKHELLSADANLKRVIIEPTEMEELEEAK